MSIEETDFPAARSGAEGEESTDAGEAPDFSSWKLYVDAAVEFAEMYEEPFSIKILEALLARGVRPAFDRRPATGWTAGPSEAGEPSPSPQVTPLARAARDAGVEAEALGRLIHLDDEGNLEILPRIDGSSKAERADRAAAVYLYLREKMFHDFQVDIEDLRTLCQNQGAYDSPNFTKTFRRSDHVLEIGGKNTREKKYRVSAKGEELARSIIQDLTMTRDFTQG